MQISSNSALENLKFFFHKSSTGATASIISTHHLSVRQFLNQYCLLLQVFLCCLENSCFLIRFPLETKIFIIFLNVFCLCIHKVKNLVDNCREVVSKTIICCCNYRSCLLYASAIFSIFPGWKWFGTELTRFNIFLIIPSWYRVVNEPAPGQPTLYNQALIVTIYHRRERAKFWLSINQNINIQSLQETKIKRY